MNSLERLIDDLNLDEALVLLRLKRDGLILPACCFPGEVTDSQCEAAREMVLEVLRGEDWESLVGQPTAPSPRKSRTRPP